MQPQGYHWSLNSILQTKNSVFNNVFGNYHQLNFYSYDMSPDQTYF
jgi:hypothetical protein